MVKDLKARQPSFNDTIKMRRQAQDLLERLLADRDRIEQRLAETGKRDPIRTVTGHTALDNAIGSAREMLRHIDEVLSQTGPPEPALVPASQFRGRRLLKPQVRLSGKFASLSVMAAGHSSVPAVP